MPKKKVFNKLVRDKIPEVIAADNRLAKTRILNDDEYLSELEKKLDEEVAEFHESKDIEELADILEVVFALSAAQGVDIKELRRKTRIKYAQRGGFDKRIFLIETEPLAE